MHQTGPKRGEGKRAISEIPFHLNHRICLNFECQLGSNLRSHFHAPLPDGQWEYPTHLVALNLCELKSVRYYYFKNIPGTILNEYDTTVKTLSTVTSINGHLFRADNFLRWTHFEKNCYFRQTPLFSSLLL